MDARARTPRRDAIAAGSTLLVLMTGYALLETARDALFLAKLPASQLPWTYLAMAAAAFVVAKLNRGLTKRADKRRVLTWTLAVLAVGTLGFWVLFSLGRPIVAHAFYVWTGVVASVAVVQFWLLLSDTFTVTEAKRLYATIAAGGVVGAIAGSTISEVLLRWAGPRHLLLVGAVFLAGAGFLPRMCGRTTGLPALRGPARSAGDTRTPAPSERPDSYINRLLALTLISTVALTLVDYLFKSAVAEAIPADQYGTFFARFYVGLNVLALIVQIGLAPRLLRTFGANRALLVLPVVLAFGAAGVVALGGLLPLLLLKAADGGLRHSIHRGAIEVLYLPLSRAVRDHSKGTTEALGQRGGQALGSLGILGAIAVGARPVHLAAAVGVLSVAWVASALGLKRLYLDLFRSHLRDGSIETQLDVPVLDLDSLESLVSALNSESDEEVLATLDLLHAYDKDHLIPVLLLYHPSEQVVLRTLELLVQSKRRDYGSVARRLLEHDDTEVRAAAMRGLATILSDDDLRSAAARDDNPVVRSAALVALIARGADTDGALERELDGCEHNVSTERKVAVIRAIRHQGDKRFADRLMRLAEGAEPDVQREVARAMGEVADARFLPHLIDMLAARGVRPDARDALEKLGTAAIEALRAALSDASTPHKVRVHIPRTLSRFAVPRVVEILLEQQSREREGLVRFKIIRALERLRPVIATSTIDLTRLREDIRETVQRAVLMLDWWVITRAAQVSDHRLGTPGGGLLLAVLEEKTQNAIDRALRLASLLHPTEDFRVITQGLRSESHSLRAESLELLEELLDASYGPALLALLDDAPPEERLKSAAEAVGYDPGGIDYAGRLRTMLRDGSEAVRCVAAYHIGELGWPALGPPLREARPEGPGFLSDIIDRTLDALQSARSVVGVQNAG